MLTFLTEELRAKPCFMQLTLPAYLLISGINISTLVVSIRLTACGKYKYLIHTTITDWVTGELFRSLLFEIPIGNW